MLPPDEGVRGSMCIEKINRHGETITGVSALRFAAHKAGLRICFPPDEGVRGSTCIARMKRRGGIHHLYCAHSS